MADDILCFEMVVECCFDAVRNDRFIVVFETDLTAEHNVVECIVEFVVELGDCIDFMEYQIAAVGE